MVLIDFWASWCGPCISEQKATAEARKKTLSSRNVVILNISIDTSPLAWKRQLALQSSQGTNLIMDSKANIKADYGIGAVPHYFVIGKKGEIIENSASSKIFLDVESLLKGLK